MENKSLYKNTQQLFRLINLLQKPRTVKELERELHDSNRQIYRYIKVLKALHYPIIKKGNRYQLEISVRPYFYTPLPGSMQIETDLPTAHQFSILAESQKVLLLSFAVQQKRRVKLLNYHSPQDGVLPERIVEPLYISEDLTRLQCYCLTEKKQRQYKIVRITEVEMTDEVFTTVHKPQSLDAFGLSGQKWLPVRMHLHKRAYHLMWEEFPAARRFILEEKGKYYFDGEVLSYYGIGRFVLGIPGDISEVEPIEFRAFLEKRVREFGFMQE